MSRRLILILVAVTLAAACANPTGSAEQQNHSRVSHDQVTSGGNMMGGGS